MLLAPFLAVVVVLVARERRRAVGHGLVLLAAALALIAPITLRNHAVFGEWVPLSINGGLTLWQGVADAGGEAEGARRRDKLVMDEEAERYGNPRYREWWAEPDGIFRDRERYRRARAVIRAHPLLYARVVAGRALEMLSYTSPGPPTLLAGDAAGALLARSADDDASDARTHDLARRPTDDRFLAPGRAAAPLRPLVGAVQAVLVRVLTPLAVLGAMTILAAGWRSALLLLALPLYYLSTESFFLYEWRVAVPMHSRRSQIRVQRRKLTTFDRLSAQERLEVIEAFSASNVYLIRQLAMLLKTGGALSVTSTTRFRKDPNQRPHATSANLRVIPVRPVAEA